MKNQTFLALLIFITLPVSAQCVSTIEQPKQDNEESQAFKAWKQKRAERELDFWVPDDVPKKIYETNSGRWRSATLLSLAYSEGPLINEDVRREIFDALSMIQESHSQVKDIHAWSPNILSDLLIVLTPQGENAIKPIHTEGGIKTIDPQDTGIPALDALNRAYDVNSMKGDSLVTLQFSKPLNQKFVFEEYKKLKHLEDIEDVWRNTRGGDGDNILLTEKEGHWHFVFSKGWGDCPSGCIYRRYYTFVFDRSGKEILSVEEKGAPLDKNQDE